MSRRRVAILISGRGSNMAALIAAARDPSYPAEIALVASNRADAPGLERARADGIPTTVVDHAAHGRDREAFERALHAEIAARGIDILCLAGFMRLFTPWFVGQWTGRMLNVHPALLPSFKGLDTHRRAIEAGVKIHGATVHLVVPETDAGPIIAQAAIAVRDDDTAEMLAERVLALEHRIYPLALSLLAAGRLRLVDGRCLTAGAGAPEGALVVPGI
ncbi:MAG TPA: phosphoribosylglycinamide formyltransferase [Xanthobacteraceae bacterium]|jgi:phosphoribosylglycinamide formyltransferase 1|nr:phosphoribosylglycinamide formyltransferase [Xanthobacteraceae bacterium]